MIDFDFRSRYPSLADRDLFSSLCIHVSTGLECSWSFIANKADLLGYHVP